MSAGCAALSVGCAALSVGCAALSVGCDASSVRCATPQIPMVVCPLFVPNDWKPGRRSTRAKGAAHPCPLKISMRNTKIKVSLQRNCM